MNGRGQRVRDLIPIERISPARIRDALKACPELDGWSCGAAGAIRPALLARLARDALWEALAVETSSVSAVLDERGGTARYELSLEVDIGSDPPLTLPIVAAFVRCGSGRIALTLSLDCGGELFELVGSQIVLAPA